VLSKLFIQTRFAPKTPLFSTLASNKVQLWSSEPLFSIQRHLHWYMLWLLGRSSRWGFALVFWRPRPRLLIQSGVAVPGGLFERRFAC